LTLGRALDPGARTGDGGAQAARGLVLVDVVLVQLDQVDLGERAQRLHVLGAEHGSLSQPVPDVVGQHAAGDGRGGDLSGMESDQFHLTLRTMESAVRLYST